MTVADELWAEFTHLKKSFETCRGRDGVRDAQAEPGVERFITFYGYSIYGIVFFSIDSVRNHSGRKVSLHQPFVLFINNVFYPADMGRKVCVTMHSRV